MVRSVYRQYLDPHQAAALRAAQHGKRPSIISNKLTKITPKLPGKATHRFVRWVYHSTLVGLRVENPYCCTAKGAAWSGGSSPHTLSCLIRGCSGWPLDIRRLGAAEACKAADWLALLSTKGPHPLYVYRACLRSAGPVRSDHGPGVLVVLGHAGLVEGCRERHGPQARWLPPSGRLAWSWSAPLPPVHSFMLKIRDQPGLAPCSNACVTTMAACSGDQLLACCVRWLGWLRSRADGACVIKHVMQLSA